MDLQGYAYIKGNTTTGISPAPMSDFENHTVRVMEFGHDDCVMVINAKANAIATFDKCDVGRSFRCGQQGDVITPPDLNMIEQMMYVGKAMSRKGGYNYMVGQMVIASSIHSGKFNDTVLWTKQ
jgi:uncharacterized protein YerC